MVSDSLWEVIYGIFRFTSENVCIPDVSTNSVLAFLYVAIVAWDMGLCFSTDTSSYLLSRHRKISAYIYLIFQHIVV